MEKFKKSKRPFSYVFDGISESPEPLFIEMPCVPRSKNGVCDIAWYTDGDAELYATISEELEEEDCWERVTSNTKINGAVTYFKVVPAENSCRIVIRVIMH